MIVVSTVTDPPIQDPIFGPTAPSGVQALFTGADGSTWDLVNGPARVQPGWAGLLPPNVAHQWATAPALVGGQWAGYEIGVVERTWPVFLTAGPDLAFLDLDAAFWKALDPTVECSLTLTRPDAQARCIPLRFVGPGDDAPYNRDPAVVGHAPYNLTFAYPDPLWSGATRNRTFSVEEPLPFFAPPGSNAVFNISPNDSTASATVDNPGDVDAFPICQVTGPVSGFSVGVGANLITGGAVAAGQSLWIDMRPQEQTVGFSRGGDDEAAWLILTARNFSSVPPGTDVPIEIDLLDPGSGTAAMVELTPRHWRPW